MPLRPIMFVGTGSDVGKSVINTAFCRIFLQDGHTPAPFKAQNMSLNSYATPDNLEIGRAQAVQADACGIDSSSDMNPVLLKPTSHTVAQVILNGKVVGNESAQEYFNHRDKSALFDEVTAAFRRLSTQYNPIVIEGAGSISEINLWDKDIVNMRMALYANAATYLIADIDKGGVFASVYGSVMLLPIEQRQLIKGVIINKFRGDISLFQDGRRIMEELTGIKVVGIIPYFDSIFIEQEDKLTNSNGHEATAKIKIAVVLLHHISNFTDFNVLEHIPDIHLYYARNPQEISHADIVIIPGSKNTIEDIITLRNSGMANAILAHHKANKPLYGICGGFQMMGQWIYDPFAVESRITEIPGLGIFPVSTTLQLKKCTKQCKFTTIHFNGVGEGYEIHSGITPTEKPFARLEDNTTEGYYESATCWGSYIHGVFDNPSVINHILQQVDKNLETTISYRTTKENQYNALADLVRQNTDMEYIYSTL